ncbi:PAP2 superfamily protein [Pseudogulbenkiania subflava DSM 22618]|uniref:PAP2 superfamily protein n=2 Tax=Pseudogulbenkiania subflava TaxID=451637 RepID=A0A1Y6BGS2_9NEIS|nr:PAP2 superfamily protein [Pseudogulbenkiania subflava DSM 22618]
MPNALTGQDGNWSIGYSFDRPYSTLWTNVTMLPALQVSARYVSVMGVPGFTDANYGGGYGRYKDKVFDAKLKLLEEGEWTPALAFGKTDLFGTELFKGHYVAATKNFGPLETTLGYGKGRIDGPFGGVRWRPSSLPNWALVAEYDNNNYRNDFNADKTFASERSPGLATGVEYRWGWLSLQAAHQRSHNSINAMVNIPLSEKEFVPKIYEPAPYAETRPRPTDKEWRSDSTHASALRLALEKQDYKLVQVQYTRGTLSLQLSNSRISNMGRAVGRAVRTALMFAPLETRTIKVTYTETDLPVATFEFFNLERLQDYLNGKISREEFRKFYLLRAATPDDDLAENDAKELGAGLKDNENLSVLFSEDGDFVQLKQQDSESNRFKLAPKLSFYFNDPSGALHYDINLSASYDKRLAKGLYLNSTVAATVLEDVSAVKQPSNSLLPHVRSDVAEYKRGSKAKLYQLMLNKYYQPAPEWYGRVSAGIYEEMYGGAGGQLLYAPTASRWAVDIAVDALKQRDFDGLGFRPYSTVTALASMHYKLPYGMTATARAGRFLAKDNGVRFELKRRFQSGVEIGAWYTYTDGKDITSPGTPSAPYHDRGIFFTLPLSSMLTFDSKSKAGFSISPWTRDVGQMVTSPGDLYSILEDPSQDMNVFDGLGNFAERADEQSHPGVAPPVERYNPWPRVRLRLDDSASALPDLPGSLKGGLLAAGAIGIASLSDKRWDNFIRDHKDNRLLKGWDSFSSVAPWLGVGAAGAAMMLGNDRFSNTGLIALQSAAVAGGSSLLIKQAVNRSRPEPDSGHWATQSAGKSKSDSSFPSNHAAMAFALATPFAEEYDAPWLYGVATASSLGRTAQRKHWLSDTVAGGLIGYVAGHWLWKAQRNEGRYQTGLNLGPDQIGVTVQKSY